MLLNLYQIIYITMKQKLGYIGSKFSLMEFIDDTIKKYTTDKNVVFCDIFGGTNIVSRYFKNKYNIITNDMEYYSYVVGKVYISNKKIVNPTLLNYFNELVVKPGIFTKTYCVDRNYFTEYNGSKIDTIRQEIEKLYKQKDIDEDEYYYYLTSLLEASDKVANTASIYSAYLKKIKKSAQKELVLLDLNITTIGNNTSYQSDANEIIKKISGDILYLDPPYNHRQYGSNYHIYNTILKYDLDEIVVKGVTGMREYEKSDYCSKVKVLDTFEDLIKNANFKYIFISYNNEGLMNVDDMRNILEKYGDLKLHIKDYKTFKADSNRNNKSSIVQEYLWCLQTFS